MEEKMAGEELKAGDVVVLNSGSDDMTIKRIDGDDVICVWYDYDNSKTVTHSFRKEMLTKQNIPDKPTETFTSDDPGLL